MLWSYFGKFLGFIVKHRGVKMTRVKQILSWNSLHRELYGYKDASPIYENSSLTFMENTNHLLD